METNKDKGIEEKEQETAEEAPEGEEVEEAAAVEEAIEEKKEETAEAVEEVEEAEETKEAIEAPEEAEKEGEVEEVERKREEEVEEEIVEERIYTIPLRRVWISPRKRRAPRAVRVVRSFIQRHMKPEAIIVSNEVNERLWSRGIEKPPRKIRVRASKDKEGTVTLHLAEGD